MKKKPFHFEYVINGYLGSCFGVSVEQATDRAKIDYLKIFEGTPIGSPLFRLKKSKIQSVKLSLKPFHLERHRFLYRSFKDGDCTEAEIHELEDLTTTLRTLRTL